MTTADDLHQRGLLAASHGHFEEAARLLGQAVAESPAIRQFHTNLGLALSRLGRHEDAVEAYAAALVLEPGHAGTLAKLGRTLGRAGRSAEGVAALEQAAWFEPDNPDTANALGAVLAESAGREEEARRRFTRAVELDPGFGEAWRNLGLLEARQERWSAAAAALGQAVALEQPAGQLVYQLGVALGRAGRPAEARLAYERALVLEPRMPEAWNNLGHVLAALGDPEAALDAVERALQFRPDFAEARYNQGVTLQSLGRVAEARRAYQLVLAAQGADGDTLNNLGGLCLSEAEPDQAIPFYQRALDANPVHPEARWNLGLAQLSTGDWDAGWRNYEARRVARSFVIPRWRHGEDLAGCSILLWSEQGLGDGVQFLRYVDAVRQLGVAHLTLECPAPLAPLWRLAEGIDRLIVRGEPVPEVDYQISLMSLPAELGTLESTVPQPGPRYKLDSERRAAWGRRLAAHAPPGRRIGIVWGGNSENRQGLDRSMPLEEMMRLSQLGGFAPVSLQHGPQSGGAADWPSIAVWRQEDLADTAALVAELDLVITVDTLMAHLAGTLARKTWLLLPFAADWRWMCGREDSPWYPGVRLFRQSRPGDWPGLVQRVAAALTN